VLPDPEAIVYLGRRDREQWSIQRIVSALTQQETSAREAATQGLFRRRVICLHYDFWDEIPREQRTGSSAICFFYHHRAGGFADPQVVAGICMNRTMAEVLRAREPHKPVWTVPFGGAEDAVLHARRAHRTEKLRLLLAGRATAPWREDDGEGRLTGHSRKGLELVLPIARRLDRRRYAWVFVGPGWGPAAEELRGRGWTVISPGAVPGPHHYRYYGEGDVYLMLSRLEGGPLTLLETMGLGLWPVCTSTGLVPELIRHGENGHRVDRYDGTNGETVAQQVADCLGSLDVVALRAATGLIRSSVAHHTWQHTRSAVGAVSRQVFGPCSSAEPSCRADET
jgi:glycosyltransferase involved in cell wall biosynthesis